MAVELHVRVIACIERYIQSMQVYVAGRLIKRQTPLTVLYHAV